MGTVARTRRVMVPNLTLKAPKVNGAAKGPLHLELPFGWGGKVRVAGS